MVGVRCVPVWSRFPGFSYVQGWVGVFFLGVGVFAGGDDFKPGLSSKDGWEFVGWTWIFSPAVITERLGCSGYWRRFVSLSQAR